MANLNVRKFIDALRNELLLEVREADASPDTAVIVTSAFNYAAITVLAATQDGASDPPSPAGSPGLTRGQKAARTRKRNAQRKREQQDTTKGVRTDGVRADESEETRG